MGTRIRLSATVVGILTLALLMPVRPLWALEPLRRDAAAVGVEPDHVFAPLGVPNDPLFASSQGYLRAVHAPEAWDVQTGDPGIVVAVLDTGLDITHPD